MSRYQIDHPQLLIHVGFDQPLKTYFAVVEDSDIEEDKDPVFWLMDTSQSKQNAM